MKKRRIKGIGKYLTGSLNLLPHFNTPSINSNYAANPSIYTPSLQTQANVMTLYYSNLMNLFTNLMLNDPLGTWLNFKQNQQNQPLNRSYTTMDKVNAGIGFGSNVYNVLQGDTSAQSLANTAVSGINAALTFGLLNDGDKLSNIAGGIGKYGGTLLGAVGTLQGWMNNDDKVQNTLNTASFATNALSTLGSGSLAGAAGKAVPIVSAVAGGYNMAKNAVNSAKTGNVDPIGGALQGAMAGAAIAPPWGAIVGGVLGAVTSSIGTPGTVDFYGNRKNPNGLNGLFGWGHSKGYLDMLQRRSRTNLSHLDASRRLDVTDGSEGATLAADGGSIPTTLAYLDDGELIRTPQGLIIEIPEEHKPTDSNLVNVPVGTQVLSDKKKVPGTNKTYAQVGKEIMKPRKYNNDRYALTSKMLNDINNLKAFDALLAKQESTKRVHSELKNGLPMAKGGSDNIRRDFPYPVDELGNYTGETYEREKIKWYALADDDSSIGYYGPEGEWIDYSDVPNEKLPIYRYIKKQGGRFGIDNDGFMFTLPGKLTKEAAKKWDKVFEYGYTPNETVTDPNRVRPIEPAKRSSTDLYGRYNAGPDIDPVGSVTSLTTPMLNHKFNNADAVTSAARLVPQGTSANTQATPQQAPAVKQPVKQKAYRAKTVAEPAQAVNVALPDDNAVYEPVLLDIPDYSKYAPTNIKPDGTRKNPYETLANNFEIPEITGKVRKRPKGSSFNTNDFYDTMLALGMLQDKAKPDQVPLFTYEPKYGPTTYDISSLLRDIDTSNAQVRYNAAQRSPSTGAGMALNIAASMIRNDAIAKAYEAKYNMENELAAKNAAIYNEWARYNAEAKRRQFDEQQKANAAAYDINAQRHSEMMNYLQTKLKDSNMAYRDSQYLPLFDKFLLNGFTATDLAALRGTYNNIRRRMNR